MGARLGTREAPKRGGILREGIRAGRLCPGRTMTRATVRGLISTRHWGCSITMGLLACILAVGGCETSAPREASSAMLVFAGCPLRWPAVSNCPPAAPAGTLAPAPRPIQGSDPQGLRDTLEGLRRHPEAGRTEIALVLSGPNQTLVFNNDRDWLCYTYAIPRRLGPGPQPSSFLSTDRRTSVGVHFTREDYFDRADGPDSLSRASSAVREKIERDIGRSLPPLELVPFTSPPAQGVRWKNSESVNIEIAPGRFMALGTKVFVSVRPEWIAVVTVIAPEGSQDLARQVLDSVRTTVEPGCYWSLLARTLGVKD